MNDSIEINMLDSEEANKYVPGSDFYKLPEGASFFYLTKAKPRGIRCVYVDNENYVVGSDENDPLYKQAVDIVEKKSVVNYRSYAPKYTLYASAIVDGEWDKEKKTVKFPLNAKPVLIQMSGRTCDLLYRGTFRKHIPCNIENAENLKKGDFEKKQIEYIMSQIPGRVVYSSKLKNERGFYDIKFQLTDVKLDYKGEHADFSLIPSVNKDKNEFMAKQLNSMVNGDTSSVNSNIQSSSINTNNLDEDSSKIFTGTDNEDIPF